MRTKDLTGLTNLIQCSEPLAKSQTEQKQGEDQPAPSVPSSVIITPDPPEPDACLWCVVEPASDQHHPYCSLDCAVASAVDDERNR